LLHFITKDEKKKKKKKKKTITTGMQNFDLFLNVVTEFEMKPFAPFFFFFFPFPAPPLNASLEAVIYFLSE